MQLQKKLDYTNSTLSGRTITISRRNMQITMQIGWHRKLVTLSYRIQHNKEITDNLRFGGSRYNAPKPTTKPTDYTSDIRIFSLETVRRRSSNYSDTGARYENCDIALSSLRKLGVSLQQQLCGVAIGNDIKLLQQSETVDNTSVN